MAALHYNDIAVGMSFTTPARTVTEADVVNFAGVSGDFNQIHTDAVHAAQTPFGGRLVHGMLVLSIATGLRQRGGLFDGTLIAFLEVREWRFLAPVHIGDTIHVITEIASMRETSKADRGIVEQRVTVRNQKGADVQSGLFVTMLARR